VFILTSCLETDFWFVRVATTISGNDLNNAGLSNGAKHFPENVKNLTNHHILMARVIYLIWLPTQVVRRGIFLSISLNVVRNIIKSISIYKKHAYA